MKYSSDTIGNPTRDLPACSTVPQQTAPPRTPEAEGASLYSKGRTTVPSPEPTKSSPHLNNLKLFSHPWICRHTFDVSSLQLAAPSARSMSNSFHSPEYDHLSHN
jgi:hypothetical protein